MKPASQGQTEPSHSEKILNRLVLIVCISERSLLAVFVAAKNPSEFVFRIQTSVRLILRALGLPSDSLDHELREMDRLGSVRSALEQQPEMDLLSLAIQIADRPCSPLK